MLAASPRVRPMPRPRSSEILFVVVMTALFTAAFRGGEAKPPPDDPAATGATAVPGNTDGRVVRIVYQPLVTPR